MSTATLVGKLCPARPREQTGRGKKLSDGTGELFCADTLTAYRKPVRLQAGEEGDDDD